MQEQIEITQEMIDAALAKFAIEGLTNEPVLQYQIQAITKAQNLGYPMEMYHASLDPRQARNQKQKAALEEMGYQAEKYIHRSWPAFKFRRNLDSRFETPDPNKGEPGDYIEMRLFRSEEQFLTAQKRERKPRTVEGDWMDRVTDLPELKEGPTENPDVTIARLQGELQAEKLGSAGILARLEALESGEPKKGPGRPKKERDLAEVS